MHEAGIALEIVDIAVRHAQGAKIKRIAVEIGKLSGVVSESIRFSFEIARLGTLAEDATLDIHESPGRVRCRSCETEFDLEGIMGRCACGSTDLEWLGGTDLFIKELEVF
jgi:hydrogenase nickel incorporation protein HypA/HybF